VLSVLCGMKGIECGTNGIDGVSAVGLEGGVADIAFALFAIALKDGGGRTFSNGIGIDTGGTVRSGLRGGCAKTGRCCCCSGCCGFTALLLKRLIENCECCCGCVVFEVDREAGANAAGG